MVETTNNPLTEDELEELKAQLEAEHRALESLRAERSNLEAQLAQKDQSIARLQSELDALKTEAEALRAERDNLKTLYANAVTKYRDLVISHNPYLADFIQGASIDEIDASVEKARNLAEKVKASLEAQTRAFTIPAGAPTRTGLPVEEMSPREKIVYGLSQKRR